MDDLIQQDLVLELILKNHNPMPLIELQKKLSIKGEAALKALADVLDHLEYMGVIYVCDKGYGPFPDFELTQGKMELTIKGNGFLCIPNAKDIKIKRDNLGGALDGDTVIINREKQVVKVIRRAKHNHIFEVIESHGKYLVQSLDNPNLFVKLTKRDEKSLTPGYRLLLKVSADIEDNQYLGNLIKVIGHVNEPDIDVKMVAYSYGIDDTFSEFALLELESIPDAVDESEIGKRRDLRDQMIFTIDGEDTKDIDDAISVELKENGHYLLAVHIADVNHYVKRGTALFKEAGDRATSVYLADSVIPMLPQKLSNGICSLHPGHDRLTITCQMEIDEHGNVVNYEIFESVINSQIKMTYGDVNKVLTNQKSEPKYSPFTEQLHLMQKLSNLINLRKFDRGYLNFALQEAKIVIDDQGKPCTIMARPYDKAEQIIENFMVMANEQIASHVYWMSLPFPYRIHELPNQEKLEDIVEFILKIGIKIKFKADEITPRHIQRLLKDLQTREEFPVLSSLILKGMQKARYDTTNEGHFGLALDSYTHFTSPIRRYPDLMVHELLKQYMVMDVDHIDFDEIEAYLKQECIHSSYKERQAEDAEMEVEMMKMAEYMEDHIGDVFTGMITYINGNGIYVQTDNLIRGMVCLHDLDDDYYYFADDFHAVIGKKNHEHYRIGNRVTLEVVGASKQQRRINFKIINRLANRERTMLDI